MSKRSQANAEARGRPGGGRCPLCDATLGAPPQKNERSGNYLPPSLRLEVAGDYRRRDQLAWRLTVIGTSHTYATTAPPFVEDDVNFIYLLCGNGHYFLEWVKLPGEAGRSTWRDQSFVAAIGPVASGKSYLLTRTLNQPLSPVGRDHIDQGELVHLERIGLTDPLESVPMDTLEHYYGDTRRRGVNRPIPATLLEELNPGAILKEYIADDFPKIASDLQAKVMKRVRSDSDQWGATIRQPIFLRTGRTGSSVLTCVADLAGELFGVDAHGFLGRRDLAMLRQCSALVWVVDPFHSEGAFEEFLTDALGDESLFLRVAEGSTRPDAARAGDLEELRRVLDRRDEISDRIATELTRDEGIMTGPIGGVQRNLVAISKCDLVELGLHKCDLGDLGERGAVLGGIVRYLEYVLHPAHIRPLCTAVAELVDYANVGAFVGAEQHAAKRKRVDQLAAALLAHYSDAGRFWNLAHGGDEDTVTLTNPANEPALDERTVSVPSLDHHLAACLHPGGARELQMRDLIMSALGCGIMSGLGHERHVTELLRQRSRYVQFYVCSPLGTVPTFDPPADGRTIVMAPSSRSFPKVGAPSAALTQLQLAILHEALP